MHRGCYRKITIIDSQFTIGHISVGLYIAFYVRSYRIESFGSHRKSTTVNGRLTYTAVITGIVAIGSTRHYTSRCINVESICIGRCRIHVKCTATYCQVTLTRQSCLFSRLRYICNSTIRIGGSCFDSKLRISASRSDTIHHAEAICISSFGCSSKITTINMRYSVRTNSLSICTGTGCNFKRTIVNSQGRTIPFSDGIGSCLPTIVAGDIGSPCFFGLRFDSKGTSVDGHCRNTGIDSGVVAAFRACNVAVVAIHVNAMSWGGSGGCHIKLTSVNNHIGVIWTTGLVFGCCTIGINTSCRGSGIDVEDCATIDSGSTILNKQTVAVSRFWRYIEGNISDCDGTA